MILPVEDGIGDVLSKAQKGLGVSTEKMATRSGLSESSIRAARRGEFDEDTLVRLSEDLNLNVAAVLNLAKGDWRPRPVSELKGFAMVCSPFYDWQVNAYLIWDPNGKQAIAIDTGTQSEGMIAKLESEGLELQAALLTHAHRDHVMGLRRLKERWPEAKAFLGSQENSIADSVERFEEGARWNCGRLEIEAVGTPGHTAGGISFLLSGLDRPVAFVGDALFAGSMGGANESYEAGLDSVHRLLSLDAETLLAPGHGPMSSVAEERIANCFSRWEGS